MACLAGARCWEGDVQVDRYSPLCDQEHIPRAQYCCLLRSTSQVSKVAAKGLWVAAGCGVASCIGTLVFADAIVNCESAALVNASDQSAEASPDTACT